MAVADIEVPPDPTTAVSLPARPAAAIISRATATNLALAEAFSRFGYRGFVADPGAPPIVHEGDLVLARFDVLPTLDGVEEGVWRLPALERQGARVLNGPVQLLAAHDKLLTALQLGRAGIAQPRTAHVRDVSLPVFPPPYVVKPRFGSWGGDVYRCDTADELIARLRELAERRWFRRQGALVQELIECDGADLRDRRGRRPRRRRDRTNRRTRRMADECRSRRAAPPHDALSVRARTGAAHGRCAGARPGRSRSAHRQNRPAGRARGQWSRGFHVGLRRRRLRGGRGGANRRRACRRRRRASRRAVCNCSSAGFARVLTRLPRKTDVANIH